MSGHLEESYEYVLDHAPFTVRRTIRWSDCDPAGIVFTGRFTEYLLGAVSLFMRHLHSGPGTVLQTLGVDTPCKGLSLVFHAPLRPDDVVDIRVTVGALRESSFDLQAHAAMADGRLAFEGVFSPICIRREPRGRVPIPDLLRERLQPHRTPDR
ncbi:thioesterase family protein [Aquabacterium sp. J223]|uniref:acyl-CoA thioesterase n=1 Tax=Aquabacterium sp. J223 TaxID=2898431 RepID=UPI0021ADF808|nr:thioesterase family protein [Aquabacterium sp. J223]UUX95216.1 acyl-CoA thioesterase [Aquabacterium sp. J223]